MRAFFDPASDLHRPIHRIAGGVLKPTYETAERTRMLLAGLAGIGVQAQAPAQDDAALDRLLARVHDGDYLAFLRDGFAQWAQNPANGPELRTSIHANRYMDRKPRDLLGLAGYYQADSSSVLVEGTWAAVRGSGHATLAATRTVIEGGGTAYALCRPPGHHAYRDQAGGFCYVNNAALAAEMALAQGARVAILDVDVHHGNGTQEIFYGRDDVLTISLHGDPADLYPFYAGYADETGRGAGEGANLNLPLPLQSGWNIYSQAIAAAMTAIRAHGTDFLVIGLGVDAFCGDPFACMALEIEDFRRLGAACGSDIRTVVVQEGGYPSAHLGDVLGAFLSGLAG